jgi:hypothetical protein
MSTDRQKQNRTAITQGLGPPADTAEQKRRGHWRLVSRRIVAIRLKQAVLSGEAIPTSYINNNIHFRANAKEYPYKTATGLPTYFTIFPEASSIPGRAEKHSVHYL